MESPPLGKAMVQMSIFQLHSFEDTSQGAAANQWPSDPG